MELIYRLPNETKAQFNWVSWDGEAVLYNSLSGDTHRLMFPAGHILKLLESTPSDSSISAGKLLQLPPDDCSTLFNELEELLTALCSIGLLKKISIEDRRPLSCGTVSSACS